MRNQIRLAVILLVAVEAVGCSPSRFTRGETHLPTLTAAPTSTEPAVSTTEGLSDVYIGMPTGGSIEYGADIPVMSSNDVPMHNMSIRICTTQIGSRWQSVISDIASLSIEAKTSSLELSKEYSYDATCEPRSNSRKANSITFELEQLPKGRSVNIVIKMIPSIKLAEGTYEGRMYIRTPTELIGEPGGVTLESAVFGRFADSAVYLIEKQWGVADLRVRVDCENCNSSEAVFNLSFRENMNIAGCKILTQDASYITESCLFWFLYALPENSSDTLPKTDDRYFLATQNVSRYDSLIETSREQFYGALP